MKWRAGEMARANLEGRNGQIWKLYCRGWTQDALAERFEVSQPRISQIIRDCRNSIPTLEREEIVKQEVDLLNTLRAEVLDLFDAAPIPLVSNGRVIEEIKDHTGRLNALARAESLTARLHKVLGLEAAQKIVVDDGEKAAAERAGAEAAAFVHGGDDDA
jgi:DNA-binding transcriptional regulator LsrR (DeoR family)